MSVSLCFVDSTSSNGVLQPFRQLGWWKWMYHLSPYTYLIEALLGQGGKIPLLLHRAL